jgi:3-hydroxybutyryl-CoA dehydrogenase
MKKERLEDYSLNKTVQTKQQTMKLGIVGCGSMGQEIAIAASAHGIDVVFIDITDERIALIMKTIGGMLDNMIDHWGMTGSEKKAILSRIKGYIGYEVLWDCTVVIESVHTKKPVNSLDLRREIFEKIENVVKDDCVIASNASTKVIDDLSIVLEKPERAIGMHFLSPAYSNKIVEVNKSWNTNEESFKTALKLVSMLEKKAVVVNGTPGNISTRLIIPLINEACELLMEGVSSVREIDECMQEGFGMQLGPFAMADKIGLDKLNRWMNGLYDEYGDLRYKTSPIIKRLVRAGLYGARTGEGFYIYENGERLEKPGSIGKLGRL